MLAADPLTVTAAQYEAWLGAQTQWSRQTRRVAIIGLQQFHRWLVDTGRRQDDPTAGIVPPSQAPCRPHPIPADVLADAMRWAHGDDWWLLRVLVTTGMRRGEVAAMRDGDQGGGWLTIRGKGGRSRRVPIPPDVEGWMHGRSPMWPDRDGHPSTPAQLSDRVRRATRGWGPHSIRHRYATEVYRASRDVLAVQRLLGHASLATTQMYLAVDDDELCSAAAAVWAA